MTWFFEFSSSSQIPPLTAFSMAIFYLLSSYIVTYAYVISMAVTKAAQFYKKEYVYSIHDYKRDLRSRVLNICQVM